MSKSKLIDNVKDYHLQADPAHDWEHIERVRQLTRRLSQHFNPNMQEVADIAAIVHEIGDAKIDPSASVEQYLVNAGYNLIYAKRISEIVSQTSYRRSLFNPEPLPEMDQEISNIVSDADKIDAVGAIGIARVFAFSGWAGRPIYDQNDPPREEYTAEEYIQTNGSTTAINHFYEKLLRIPDLMKTKMGYILAQDRVDFMEEYINKLLEEIQLYW